MAEGTQIPGSPACGEWETLLADALDGLLKPEEENGFSRTRPAARPAQRCMKRRARAANGWSFFLLSRRRLLAAGKDSRQDGTGPRGGGRLGSGLRCLRPRICRSSGICSAGLAAAGIFRADSDAVQPRLMMTAAMAFFSIALTLNLAGVRLTSLHLADLRPKAVRSYMERQLTMASVPIVRYYDHLRFVYEVESRVRALRGAGRQSGKWRAATATKRSP